MSYFILGALLYFVAVYISITDNEKFNHCSLSDHYNSLLAILKKKKEILSPG